MHTLGALGQCVGLWSDIERKWGARETERERESERNEVFFGGTLGQS